MIVPLGVVYGRRRRHNLRQAWPDERQAATADSMTMGSSLKGAVISRLI
jgi:hypothetical protein